MAGDRLVLIVIGGDLEVHETKVANLRLGLEAEVGSMGIVTSYASCIGLQAKAKIVADESNRTGSNFAAGPNKTGYHLGNVN